MLGIAAGKHLERTLMAGGTHFVGRIGRHEYGRRHMGLVAFFALGGHHIRAVRFMTLGAERNLAMNIMAEAARQSAMLALDLLHLNDLLGMARQTLFGDIVCKLDDFWGMWIVMTAHTVGQVVMSLAGVTLATGRDNFFYRRRMTGMAVLTSNTRLVCAAVSSNIGRRSRMALDAVRTGQHRPVGGIR